MVFRLKLSLSEIVNAFNYFVFWMFHSIYQYRVQLLAQQCWLTSKCIYLSGLIVISSFTLIFVKRSLLRKVKFRSILLLLGKTDSCTVSLQIILFAKKCSAEFCWLHHFRLTKHLLKTSQWRFHDFILMLGP